VSTQVKYFVTCRTSSSPYQAAAAMGVLPQPPSPAPRHTPGVYGIGRLAPNAPKGMAATQDQQTCAQHMTWIGGLACQTGLSTGALALVWNSGDCERCFDGYHVYRVDSGHHDLLQTQPDKSITGTLFKREDGPFEGRCYAVSSYSAKGDSEDSNAACIGGGQVQHTDTFTPTNQRSSYGLRQGSSGLTGAASSGVSFNGTNPGGELIVGFRYTTEKFAFGDSFYNRINRMGLLFDLSTLSGKTVTKAILHLYVDHTETGGSYAVDHSTSCAKRIGQGVDRWWQYNEGIAGNPGLAVNDTGGPDVTIDVTAFVQGWAHNTNFGLVLYGAEENLNVFTENSCKTWYTNASSLEVTHY
jgi:hypothetical protein